MRYRIHSLVELEQATGIVQVSRQIGSLAIQDGFQGHKLQLAHLLPAALWAYPRAISGLDGAWL